MSRTVHDQWLKDNELDEEFAPAPLSSYVGRKVRHQITMWAETVWSDEIYTITEYDDDACGDGCCTCFKISGGDKSLCWRSDQLLLVEE